VDWGSFWTGVAGTVVASLIVAAVVAGVRWYGRRRKRKAKEAEDRRQTRSALRVGAHEVARELRGNAKVVKRFEEGDAPFPSQGFPSEGKYVALFEWRRRKSEMVGLRDENPELWHELETAYAALDLARHGMKPPRSDDLSRLADRLDEAAER
jgi:hypothetical protein